MKKVIVFALAGFAIGFIGLCRPAVAQTHTYYVAAEEVIWNYAPSGMDRISGKPLPKPAF